MHFLRIDKWSEATCTKPVLPASEPWPTALESAHVFVQLHIPICANVQMYLCNPVTAVCADARASNTFLCTLCAAACAHTVTAVPDPSAKNPVRVVKILT